MPGKPFRDDPTRPQQPVWKGRGEPWPAGNTLSMLHGIYSQRVRDPIEERIAEVLRQSMEQGLGNAYNPALDEHAIRRAARALTTVEMVEARIDEFGVDSISARLATNYKNASNQARHWLGELGLTPAARAKLGVDVARQYDLVSALEQRREQRERERPPTRATRLCDYCEDEPARYRVRSQGRVICEECRDEGAHR